MSRLFKTFPHLVMIILIACNPEKKPSMMGDETVTNMNIVDFFEPLSLSYQVGDSVLTLKPKDSLQIAYSVFAQIFPDTITYKLFGKENPKIYAVGKFQNKDAETYLLVRAETKARKMLLLVALDKQLQFIAALPAMEYVSNRNMSHTLSIDRRFAVQKLVTRKNKDGNTSEGREVFVLNEAARNFIMILTEALDENMVDWGNPIDTLAASHKFSADYWSGSENLVSIRDGRKDDRLTFFYRFKRNNGACTGEIKGEALIKGRNKALFKSDTDPCMLQIIFSSGSVSIQEVEGCGSLRDINCSLNGTFYKKKK